MTKVEVRKKARDFFVGINGKEIALIADDCARQEGHLFLYLSEEIVAHFVYYDYYYIEELCDDLI